MSGRSSVPPFDVGSNRWMIFRSVIILFIWLLTADAQSTCLFMRETPFDLTEMPAEPQIPSNLTTCRPIDRTCCTAAIEAEMEDYARLAVDRFVHDHLVLLRHTLDDFARDFRAHFRNALSSTRRQLDRMFRTTYGHFYTNNAKIFADFFDELDEQFAADDQPKSGVKVALATMFRKIFIVEFSLMNPLRQVTDTERHCMARIQTHLRPFGQLPTKIATQLDRAFGTWKKVVDTLERTSIVLINVADRLRLSASCTVALVRLRECHVCSGVPMETRPCLGFCLNVLRGCFADVAELEPQWEELIDVLQLLVPRLEGASNPYSVMAPMPVQISEAVMIFQERGDGLSSRIIFQCFEPLFRLKRSTVEADVVEKPWVVQDGESAIKLLGEYFDAEYHKADMVKKDVLLFSDRLSRMRGAWRALPAAICSDGQVAAPSGEGCWNGERVAPYRRPLAQNGVRAQKRNPEFGADLKVSRETFIEERVKLAAMARQLEAVYDGRIGRRNEPPMVEGSALEDLGGSDDEEMEGSAYNKDDEEEQAEGEAFSDLLDIRLLEQRRPSSGRRTSGSGWILGFFFLLSKW